MSPYALLDDHFHGHPKVLGAGLAGMGLFAWALSYAADHLTDGYIPGRALPSLPGVQPAVKALLHQGLFEPASQGYAIHDYLEWQKSRAEVLRNRAQAADRKGRWRGRRNGTSDA